MAHRVHVLLVENDSKDHDRALNILQYFSYKVTTTKHACTALSILSKGKVQFDLVMMNMNSLDSYGFQLLHDANKMDVLVILMLDENDPITIMRALEQGVLLCIQKPLTLEIIRCLWQHVIREKTSRLREKERSRDGEELNTPHKEFGEEDHIEGNTKGNSNVENKYKSKKKVKSGTSQHDNVMFKKKVWAEWTQELHEKFMDVVTQLGEGRCFPKEIVDLMNVPGLTRMQVASHLQKCRNANWVPPQERKSRQPKVETTPLRNKISRAKTLRFGSMPCLDSSQSHARIQNYHENHQESTKDNHDGSSNKGYHLQTLLDHGNYVVAQGNETFNMGQLGQTFGMDETFVCGTQKVSQTTTYTSSNQRDIIEDGLEFPNLVQNFSSMQQELGMDYHGSLQSIVLDLYHNQESNATNQWSRDVPKSANNDENEGHKEG